MTEKMDRNIGAMKKTGIYRIAEQNIRITSIYNNVHEYCREYRMNAEDAEDVSIQVDIVQEDIERERLLSKQEAVRERQPAHRWSDAYLEELAVYRSIAEQMPKYDTFLIHGSAVSVDGKAYLFTAKSGTGKSTHVRLWQELLGDRAVVINDDKPLVRITENHAVIYGTPYNGKHRSGSNISVPLKAICLLHQSEQNHIRPMIHKDAFPILLQQSYRSDNPETMSRIVSLLTKLTALVSFWEMDCNMDINAARVAFEAMSGSELP